MLEFDCNSIIVQRAYYIEKKIDVDKELFSTSLDENLLKDFNKKTNYFYRNDGNLIIEAKNKDCNCIYLLFKVFSKRRCKVLLSFKSYILCKYWNNGSFIGMGKHYCFTELNEGVNSFVVQHFYEQGQKYNYSCRISDLSFELENEENGLIADNYSFDRNIAYLCHSDSYLVNGEQYGFMLVPNDDVLIDQKQMVGYKIIDYYSGCIKKEGHTSFNVKEIINTSDYKCDDNSVDYLMLSIDYINSFNESCCINEKILIQPINEYERIKSRIAWIINEKKLKGYDKFLLDYYYNHIEKMDYDKFTYEAFDAILKAQNGFSLYDEITTDGNHCILYKSKLDGEYRKIYIYVSGRGETNKPYPLLLNFLYNTNENNCYKLSRYDNRFIAADVQSLGFTSGSYMGEACISEIIEIIGSFFNIDKKRICATGYSNGATALWAYSIYHPELFSAIYLLSGHVNCDYLSNILNKKILNTTSSNDVMKKSAFDKPTDFFSSSKEYRTRIIQEINHSDLLKMQYKKNVLDWILSAELDMFPREIQFVTNHMVHNKSYWVTIDGISYSKKEASVFVKVVEDTIIINTSNVTSFTIAIPPYINKSKIRVAINEKNIDYPTIKDTISFVVEGGIRIVSNPQISTPIYKGLGLLYPFLRPLKIYLPKNYTENMLRAAEAFANPKTNGIDSSITISYPIVFDKKSILSDDSLIVIDQNSNDDFIESFKELCWIKTDKEGYFYKNKYYTGKYCIFQIVESGTKEKEKYILYINSNDNLMLKKCLFTRRVVISGYFNGYNPYWNNAALIFDGKKFCKIYEYGMEIENV